jgi:hypothetical protein
MTNEPCETTYEPINLLRCKLLGKGFLRNGDIAQIVPCSKGKASEVMRKIKSENVARFRIFPHSVFTDEFMKFMGWDMGQIEQDARREKELYSP